MHHVKDIAEDKLAKLRAVSALFVTSWIDVWSLLQVQLPCEFDWPKCFLIRGILNVSSFRWALIDFLLGRLSYLWRCINVLFWRLFLSLSQAYDRVLPWQIRIALQHLIVDEINVMAFLLRILLSIYLFLVKLFLRYRFEAWELESGVAFFLGIHLDFLLQLAQLFVYASLVILPVKHIFINL